MRNTTQYPSDAEPAEWFTIPADCQIKSQTDPFWYAKLATIGVGTLAVVAVVLMLSEAVRGATPGKHELTKPSSLPQFVLPDTCTVTDYDRLGRATHISCVLNASEQDILLSNQAEVDTANESGFSDGYNIAAEQVLRVVDVECQQRALEAGNLQSRFAVTASDMCAKIKRSMTAQFLK